MSEEKASDLSAAEEAALDADPLQRIYDGKLEAPASLAPTLGVFTKLVAQQDRDDIADYAVEFFEQLKLQRAADPTINIDTFLSGQLKSMSQKAGPAKQADFEPPASLSGILIAFSREVIRYQPSDLFTFGLEYFTALSSDGRPDAFLARQAKVANERQAELNLEKKRTALSKQKSAKKKVAMTSS